VSPSDRAIPLLLRAIVILLPLTLGWTFVAVHYNRLLVNVAQRFLADDLTLRVDGITIYVQYSPGSYAGEEAINGLVLHWGLILALVVVSSTPGFRAWPDGVSLMAAFAIFVILHVSALTLFAIGFAEASKGQGAAVSMFTLFRAFALFWGLLPPIAAGAWCYWRWLPALRQPR